MKIVACNIEICFNILYEYWEYSIEICFHRLYEDRNMQYRDVLQFICHRGASLVLSMATSYLLWTESRHTWITASVFWYTCITSSVMFWDTWITASVMFWHIWITASVMFWHTWITASVMFWDTWITASVMLWHTWITASVMFWHIWITASVMLWHTWITASVMFWYTWARFLSPILIQVTWQVTWPHPRLQVFCLCFLKWLHKSLGPKSLGLFCNAPYCFPSDPLLTSPCISVNTIVTSRVDTIVTSLNTAP